MIYTHSLDNAITSEHTEIPAQTGRLETRVPGGGGGRPASPANNTRDYYGNLHHAISKVVQKATLTPTIKRETVYTKECHITPPPHPPAQTCSKTSDHSKVYQDVTECFGRNLNGG